MLAKPLNSSDVAVLKRVAVPDKDALASMRTEVETMVGGELFPSNVFAETDERYL